VVGGENKKRVEGRSGLTSGEGITMSITRLLINMDSLKMYLEQFPSSMRIAELRLWQWYREGRGH